MDELLFSCCSPKVMVLLQIILGFCSCSAGVWGHEGHLFASVGGV